MPPTPSHCSCTSAAMGDRPHLALVNTSLLPRASSEGSRPRVPTPPAPRWSQAPTRKQGVEDVSPVAHALTELAWTTKGWGGSPCPAPAPWQGPDQQEAT